MHPHLRELVAINRAITSSLDYEEVLHLVVEKTTEFTGADSCVLLLVDDDGLARVAAAHGISPENATSFAAPLDERINTELRQLLEYDSEDTFLGVPVIEHGSIRGLLGVYYRGAIEAEPDRELWMSALADQAAIAIEHAAHYREVVRLSESKSRLLEAVEATETTYLAYLDTELRFVGVNAAYCDVVGQPEHELIGRRFCEVFVDASQRVLLEQVLHTGEPVRLEELAWKRDSETFYWRWNAHPVHNGGTAAAGVVISAVDVTETVRARRAVEMSSRRKDEFLAMLAHELRNPLAALSNGVELLRLKLPEDPVLGKVRDVVGRQVGHMSRLLDDLLDVSRISRGKIHLEQQPVEVGTWITHAVQMTRPIIDAKEHELSVSLPSQQLFVRGDPERLAQVVSNLLSNAAKYTAAGGKIAVKAERLENEVRVRVRDSGMGIPSDLLPHLFELFVQSDRSLDRSQGGLGIGLTIVKRLVDMHGGCIEARSDGPGCGAELELRLPLINPPAERVDAGEPRTTASRNTKRILLAEDDEDTAELLKAVLELEGHQVVAVGDGPAALAAAEQHTPDVVLLDIGLPGIDGFEVAQRIERMVEEKPKLIALSGYGGEHHRQRSAAVGIQHHLVKPVDIERLKRLLVE